MLINLHKKTNNPFWPNQTSSKNKLVEIKIKRSVLHWQWHSMYEQLTALQNSLNQQSALKLYEPIFIKIKRLYTRWTWSISW